MAAGNVSRQEVWAFSGKSKDSFRFRDHQGSRLGTSCFKQAGRSFGCLFGAFCTKYEIVLPTLKHNTQLLLTLQVRPVESQKGKMLNS